MGRSRLGNLLVGKANDRQGKGDRSAHSPTKLPDSLFCDANSSGSKFPPSNPAVKLSEVVMMGREAKWTLEDQESCENVCERPEKGEPMVEEEALAIDGTEVPEL